MIKSHIAPSSCAVLKNGQVHTTSSGSCLRQRWFKARGAKRPEIDPIYQEAGAFWEREVAADLTRAGIMFVDQYEVQGTIDGISIRGEVDLWLPYSRTFIECKALVSSNRRLKIIRKGEVDMSHLLQVVCYLLATRAPYGVLRYAFVHHVSEVDKTLIAPLDTDKGKNRRDFVISIDNDANILVDGERYKYSVEDLWAYCQEHVDKVAGAQLPNRPYIDPFDKWSSPCNRCVLPKTCDNADLAEMVGQPMSEEQLLQDANQQIQSYQAAPVEIYAPKIRKGKKK